jgi:transposase
MKKLYTVKLEQTSRPKLEKMLKGGNWPVRQLKRARILLLADRSVAQPDLSDDQIADKVGCGRNTVQRTRQRYVLDGLEAALTEKARPGHKRKLDPKQEQRVVALACTTPPAGAEHWTLDLLTQAVIQHQISEAISDETLRQILHRHDLKPWLKKRWCIPRLDAEYIRRMLDVLEVYERPFDPKRPVVCIAEKSFQLLSSKRKALALSVSKPLREDYEYQRNGTANAFVAVEPLGKTRHVRVTARRTARDFAAFVYFIVMVKYAAADKVVLVTDNLNTHFAKSLVQTFGQAKADQIMERIEWHYTPCHGSWLNMAEIEINVLSKQCLRQRLGDRATATKQIRAWQRRRNLAGKGIAWQFTQAKARERFKLIA